MTVLLPLLSQSCWHNPVQVAVTIGDSNVPHVAHLPHCFVVVIPDAFCSAQPQPQPRLSISTSSVVVIMEDDASCQSYIAHTYYK